MENSSTRYGKYGYALRVENVPKSPINTGFSRMRNFRIDIYRLYRLI